MTSKKEVTSKILAVVVTFNRKEMLAECLQSLLDQQSPCDILIVDNASTDGTFESISTVVSRPNINYVNTEANLGGAGGFNFALKYVYGLDYDYYWLMDDDTIPDTDALTRLIEVAKSKDNHFGFIASFARFTDGNACLMNLPKLTSDWYDGNKYTSGVVKINQATFVGFFTQKKVVKKLGLPIKDFFIWADDTEYSRRIAATYPSYLALNSQVTHKMKKNGNVSFRMFLREDGNRVDRYFYSYRNKFFLARQEGVLATLLYSAKVVSKFILTPFLAKDNRWRKMRIIMRGFTSGIFFNPDIEYVDNKQK